MKDDLRIRLSNAEQHLAVLLNRRKMIRENEAANEREIAQVVTRVHNLREQINRKDFFKPMFLGT